MMSRRTIIRPLVATLALSAACAAQNAPAPKSPDQPCSNQPVPKPCSTQPADTKKPSSAAEQFPFPGEPEKPATAAPSAPSPDSPAAKAASEHPFPADAPPLPGADSSSSSSSSSSSDSPDPDAPTGPPLDDAGSWSKSARRKLPKVENVQSDDERVDEDLTVAKFYEGRGNFNGAYLRAKDAVKIQPDYSAAHFALAQIAQKLNKRDEAITEFKAYLKLDPNGEKAKAAQKALTELQ